MANEKVALSIIWTAVMLTFLLGDVIRIFAGDVTLGEIQGAKITQGLGLGIAALMVIPILMVVLSLVLPHDINRWANIIVAAFWLLFNLVGLPSYRGQYDKFLLAVSMVFNLTTIWYAWKWV
jgi:hypothetical protein